MSLYGPSTTIPVYSVLTGVGIALTSLRFWVRTAYARRPLGMDDILIVIGISIVSACTAMQLFNAVAGGSGEAISDETAKEKWVVLSRKIDWTMIVIEKAAFGAIKLSFLFFYRRIFGVWESFRHINNTLIGLIAAWTLAFILADIFLCGVHPELIWVDDQTVALGRCGNRGALLLVFSVTSVATDILVLGLPFLYIGRLQMSRQKMWASAVVFLLGFVQVQTQMGYFGENIADT